MRAIAPVRVLAAVLVAALGGCASAPADRTPDAPADIDPTGTFSISTTVQGTPVEGQLRIHGEPGAFNGSFYSSFTGQIPFSAVTVDGPRVVIMADTPDGPIEIRLVFDGDTFTGDWSGGTDGGVIRGRRVRG